MEVKKGIFNGRLSGKGTRFLNRDVLVFTFFLFLSFILWYLNSLRKEIEVEVKYPVMYINVPKDRTISSNIPGKLALNLNGPGYSIVNLKLSTNRAPLVVDFSKVTWKKVPESRNLDYYIISSGLITNFTNQLRSEFQIVSIKPDTIFFALEKKVISDAGTKSAAGGKK